MQQNKCYGCSFHKSSLCETDVKMFSKITKIVIGWLAKVSKWELKTKLSAKHFLQDINPRWRTPEKLSSDNGSHFVNSAISFLAEKYVLI